MLWCGPALVKYGDPDPDDDNYPSVYEIRDDAIHIDNFTMKTFRTLPPPQAPPAFSVYRYVATHSCPCSWWRGKSWWWGTCDGDPVAQWSKLYYTAYWQKQVWSGEGSISVPSPVTEKKIEKQGRAQEQSTLCAAHIMAIRYRTALRYPFGGVGSNSIPRWKIRWDSLVCFPFLFHCTLEGSVRQFWATMSSDILFFCCLLISHVLGQTIMQFLLSGMQNSSRRIHISHGAADKLGLQF